MEFLTSNQGQFNNLTLLFHVRLVSGSGRCYCTAREVFFSCKFEFSFSILYKTYLTVDHPPTPVRRDGVVQVLIDLVFHQVTDLQNLIVCRWLRSLSGGGPNVEKNENQSNYSVIIIFPAAAREFGEDPITSLSL